MRLFLNGGLGNQLFQCSKAICDNLDNPGSCELSSSIVDSGRWLQKWILNQRLVANELSVFNVDSELGEQTSYSKDIFALLVHKVIKKLSRGTVDFFYISRKLSLPFYSLSYFQNIENAVRAAGKISFNPDFVDEKNYSLGLYMQENPCVAVHVRRGDYLHEKNNYFAKCSVNYYEEALGYCEGKEVFVFSDDISWAKKCGVFPDDSIYVSHNKGDQSFLDMYLMSKADVLIVANSTFSVWAGLLSKAVLVICPREYYRGKENHLVPDGWVVLDN